MARRAGAILAVADVGRSVAFYRELIGFEVEALYDDPPYATLTLAGARLSLAEQDRRLADAGVLAEPYEPPPSLRPGVAGFAGDASSLGGCRFFCVDPDGYLVEIEQPA